MNRKSKSILKHLSRSILLKESASPVLLRIVLAFFICIIVFFIFWAANIELNQVVITSGDILTKDDVALIQHPQGGIISQIPVKNGELVDIGDSLIIFDNTDITNRIKEEQSRINTLNLRINSLKEELDIKKKLLDQELISKTSYLTFRRNYTESVGERTQAYLRLEHFQEQSRRLLVISPIYGYVHSLKNRSIGTIIKAGETIFEIIPYKREYIAELRLSAEDRGKVAVGQKTTLKLKSYSFTKYGGLVTKLDSISATTFSDSYNRTFYKAYANLPQDYIGNNEKELKILPGMTLTGEISIGSKSLLEYLIVPVRAATDAAFNEP